MRLCGRPPRSAVSAWFAGKLSTVDENFVASGTFVDGEAGAEAYWNVRATPVGIAIALSLRSKGDVQVVADRDTARLIGEALLAAVG